MVECKKEDCSNEALENAEYCEEHKEETSEEDSNKSDKDAE